MKYSKLIEFLKYTIYPNKDRIKKSVYRNYAKRTIAQICIIALCISALSFLSYTGIMASPTASACDVPEHLKPHSLISSVVATKTKNDFIKTDTKFKITTSQVTTTDELSSRFEIHPKTEFTLTKTSGNTFTISFPDQLKQNTFYKIESKYFDKTVFSWAFQTTSEFKIISVSPEESILNSTQSIEVEFTNSKVENFSEAFSIYPSIAGTFEKYGKKWLFIPSTEYEPNTLYTVTIDKSVSDVDGNKLDKNYSFSFYYQPEQKQYFKTVNTTIDAIATFDTKDIPQIVLDYSEIKLSSVDVTIYKAKTVQDFIKLNRTHLTPSGISTSISNQLSNCVKLKTFTYETNKKDKLATIELDEKLDKGQYIVEIKANNFYAYQMLQITDIVADHYFDKDSLYIFANYSNYTQPLKSASVSLEDHTGVITNADGLASFHNVSFENNHSKYLTIVKDNDTYTCSIVQNNELNTNDTVLITDSCNYRPGDTVKLKGFSQPNSNLQLDFSFTDNYLEITSENSGYFEADFIIPDNIVEDTVIVNLKNSDVLLFESKINVLQTNSQYTLSVTSDKKSYFNGDLAVFALKVTDANGVSVSDVVINTPDGKTVKTDNNGCAQYTETVTYSYSLPDHFPEMHSAEFSINADLPVLTRTDFYVFESEVYFYSTIKETEQKKALSLTASYLSQSVKNGSFFDYNIDSISDFVGETVSGQFLLQLHEIQNDTKDPDKSKDEIISEFEFSVKSGKANVLLPTFEEKSHIYAVICDKETKKPLSTIRLYEQNADSENLILIPEQNEYFIGDNVNLKLLNKFGEISNGRILVCLITDKSTKNILFSCNDKIDFEFEGDTIVKALYFDGNKIHKIDEILIESKTDKLIVNVSTDKSVYLPNGNINAQINVIDNNNKGIQTDLIVTAISTQTVLSNRSPLKPIYFEHIKTDKDGNANITFEATEHLDNYVLKVFAINKNLSGYTEKSFTVEKSFYIHAFLNDSYTIDDSIVFTARINSTKDPEPIKFTATILKDGSKISETVNEYDSNTDFSINLGNFEEGKYKLRLTARGSAVVDTKEFTFNVNNAQELIETYKIFSLENGLHLDTNEYASDVSLTFYDEKYDLYLSVANILGALPQDFFMGRVANKISESLLKNKNLNVDDYKNLRELSYYTDNIAETIRMSPEIINYSDSSILKQKVYELLYSTNDTTEIVQCYYALACFGESILGELNSLKAELSDLTDEQTVFLALAYSYSGDYVTAYDIYTNYIVPKLKSANGISSFESGGTLWQTVYMTAITSKLSSKLSAVNSRELIKYLIADAGNINIYSDVLITFVNECIPTVNAKNTVYMAKSFNDSQEITYNGIHSDTIILPKNTSEPIYIENSQGSSIAIINAYKN